MKRNILGLAALAAMGLMAGGASAGTVVVNSFAATNGTPGVWGVSDSRTGTNGSSATITNAPAGDPVGPGAALLTTDPTNTNSIAEVGIANNYGLASSVINTINLAYEYYKPSDTATASGDAAAAPSLKLTFLDASYTTVGSPSGDRGFITFVYEPYWNGPNPTTDTWVNSGTIDATHGEFWETGGFGEASGAGGPPLDTLAGWLSTLDSTSNNQFSNATLVGVEVGVGTTNLDQHDYFDDVSIDGTSIANTTYNFEPVPLPASAWSGLALLGGLGLLGGIKRLRKQMA